MLTWRVLSGDGYETLDATVGLLELSVCRDGQRWSWAIGTELMLEPYAQGQAATKEKAKEAAVAAAVEVLEGWLRELRGQL